ncbi:hypothetical protein SAMN05660464_1946, partial [Geodermatophilus dictyosporus]
RADDAISAVQSTQQRADDAISAVQSTQQRADTAIGAVEGTQQRADGTIGGAEGLVTRIDPLLGRYEQPLTQLAPSVQRLAETLDPHEVEALVGLVDRLPTLVTHLDEAVLPVLESLGDVGTDVHDLVDTMRDIREVVKGFPGSRLFRRRGRDEIADEDDEGAQERTGS